MSHVTHKNESCHTTFIWMRAATSLNAGACANCMRVSRQTYEWVMTHIWMSQDTHMNGSCHTYELCHNTLQHTATHCSTLQHTATHCNTLQHTATHCSTLQTPAQNPFVCVTRCSSTCGLQFTAAHCNTPKHTATHRNTLQHTATHHKHLHTTHSFVLWGGYD